MGCKTLKVDVNAHVANVSCSVVSKGCGTEAVISFDNLGYGEITAIKFSAKGTTSFGDTVCIGGKEEFSLIVQDISVPVNAHAENLIARIPNPDIRQLELQEKQICYGDGSVVSYEGPELCSFDLVELDNKDALKDAMRKKFGSRCQYVPQETAYGWVCSCGRLNKSSSGKCSLCNNLKNDVFGAADPDNREAVISEYEQALASEQEEVKRRQSENEKLKKKHLKYGVVACLALVALIIAIGLGMDYASRAHFASESEMKNAIEGVYTEVNGGDYANQLKIDTSSNTLTERYNSSYGEPSDIDWDIDGYDPASGTIDAYQDAKVLSNGNIEYDGVEYRKGGYWSTTTSSSSSSSSKYESVYTALSISGKVTSNSGYTKYEGKITNNGSRTYRFVKVKGSFKDSSGTVVDTDWTYAVGSEGLVPGESTSFTLSVKKDSSIKSCSTTIQDYD